MKKARTTTTLADIGGLSDLRLAKQPKLKRQTTPAPRQKSAPIAPASQSTTAELTPEPRSVGRPRTGKRSNEDYRGVTVYIQKTTQANVDDLLRKRRRRGAIAPGEPTDVSELVEVLLANWYQEQPDRAKE